MRLHWPVLCLLPCLIVACAHHSERPELPLSDTDVLAMQHGFAPLRDVQRDDDDFEIRVWSDFLWLSGSIIQYVDGELKTYSMIEEDPEFPSMRSMEVIPGCFTDDVVAALLAARPFDLPEIPECPEPCLERLAMDSSAWIIESVRDGVARRQTYDNPGMDSWDSRVIEPARVLRRTVSHALGSAGRTVYRPHREPLGAGSLILLRDGSPILAAYAIQKLTYDEDTKSGDLEYQAATFEIDASGEPSVLDAAEARSVRWERTLVPSIDLHDFVALEYQDGEFYARLIDPSPHQDTPEQLAVVNSASLDQIHDALEPATFRAEPAYPPPPCSPTRIPEAHD